MTRWFFAALFLCASFAATACPLCLGAFRSSVAQQLVNLPHAVLAQPSADGREYRVVAVIKGERPAGGIIAAEAIQLDDVVAATATLLLVRDDAWSMWVGVGAVAVEHASWLRQIAAGKRSSDMNADEWRARVALMLPYLEHREPLVAEIAYGELAAAPYAALLAAKPRLDAPAIRRWLADPKLAARQPLYLLLLGIAGDARDATALELRTRGVVDGTRRDESGLDDRRGSATARAVAHGVGRREIHGRSPALHAGAGSGAPGAQRARERE